MPDPLGYGYALIDPELGLDIGLHTDLVWKTEAAAWKYTLMADDAQAIEKLKAKGVRVVKVKIVEVTDGNV